MFNFKETILKTTALFFSATLTAACLSDDVSRTALDQQDYVKVNLVAFDYLVAVDSASGNVGEVGFNRMDAFLRGLSPRFGDKIEITGGAVSGRADIAKHLKPLMLPVYETAVNDGPLKITLHRAVASVANCGDWGYDENPLAGNDTNRNYGCSNETNLARMIADPNDLIEGKSATSAPIAAAEMIAIQKYRAGELKIEEGSVKISDLARGGTSQ